MSGLLLGKWHSNSSHILAMAFDEGNYFREKARGLNGGLLLRLDEFVNEFPAGAPSELIEIIKLFVGAIDVELSRNSDASLLRQYCGLISHLASFLQYLDNAHTAQTPRGLVALLEQTANVLFSKSVLLVSPSSAYNYFIADIVPTIRQLAVRALSPDARKPLEARLPETFYIVQFPRVERDNILNHAIFGHEFGHPIGNKFLAEHEQEQIYKNRLTEAKEKIKVDAELAKHLATFPDALAQSQQLNKMVEAVTKIHRRGLEELISDAVGVYLFGPSALFAGFDILGQSALDEPPAPDSGYPPSRYRIRLMYDLLVKSKHIDVLADLPLEESQRDIAEAIRSILKFIKTISEGQADKANIKGRALVRIAYEWLEQTLPAVQDAIEKRIASAAYSTDSALAELPALLKRLSLQVPPNEIGVWPDMHPVDWRSAILAAWLISYSQLANVAMSADVRRQHLATTQKLAAKGVEYAILRRQHEEFLASGTGVK